MKKFLWLLIAGVLAPLSAVMAQGSVKGKIVDKATGDPVEFVNVVVNTKESNSMSGGAITDEKGHFSIDGLKYGSYVLNISYIGYQNTTREFTLSEHAKHANFKEIAISEDNQVLKEVEITGIRSQMKFEIDKKVFNVDQAIAATGGSASDILQNIPSVEVNTEGTVSLRGSESVTVWINGKAQGLTADNQGDILEQMPAESIERIEVITNPSAKYSPEGTVGIINIVLKRDRKAGYYGSAQAGASMYDTDFGGYNASANINYSSGKFDAYANVSYRERRHMNENTSYRENYLGTDTTYLDQLGYGHMNGRNMFARAGMTWYATKKDQISVDLMSMMGSPNRTNVINYTSGHGTIPGKNVDNTRLRTTESTGNMLMYNLSLGYRHEWSTVHWLDFTASRHNWGNTNSSIYQDTTFVNAPLESSQYVPLYSSFQEQISSGNSTEYELQLDYENAFNENHKLQAGYRGTFSRENNPVETYAAPDKQQEIAALYNRFVYNRDLHALYATYSGKLWKNFGYQVGLRGEYYKVSTNSLSKETAGGDEIPHFEKIDPVFQLFPSVFLSYQLPNDNELQVNYTKRVRRPWGGQLNSFHNISDSTNISFGNPLLKPEYSNAFEFNYLKSWENHMLSVSAYYRTTEDIMQRISYMENGIMYSTSDNVAQSLSSGVEIVGKNRFFGKLDLTTTLNMYYYKLDAFDFLLPNGEYLHGKASEDFSWNLRMMANMGLPKAWSLQVTGMYNAKSVIAQGYRAPNYGLDAGVRKQFAGGKWSVSLNGRDLLNSRRFHSEKWGPDFYQNSSNFRGGRQINGTLTYSFGNMRAKKPRKMDNNSMQPEYGGGDGLEYDM
ncbi:MAG: TonB-dependent receptor [Bacteroidaceae bacterium]|nr:TonB-dependent receptor [Bacteroidaceae bacterium]